MKTRMQPIGMVWQNLPRVVRDMSVALGKKIEIKMDGADTELDRTIIEAIKDPLIHLVRNSCDHGIEYPEARLAAGKSAYGTMTLRAYHEGGQVNIEVGDDGGGIDVVRVKEKALEKGLVRPEQLEKFSEREAVNLIFLPGFSTAQKVTKLSGRGVGMDVVKQQMQKLRGRIEIESKASIGTTFFLKLPLTLAIIEGLVLAVGDNHYVLPLYSVIEVFRAAESQLSELTDGAEAVALRGSLVAIVRLHERFDVIPQSHTVTDGVLILTESHGRPFCLFVDAVVGQQEIVIKSLDEEHRNIPGVAGCAILADRRVGLILDVDGIVTADSSHGDR